MTQTLNQRWAANLVAALLEAGVKHVVVAPGSRSTPLALAWAEASGARVWPVIDERAAAFFALGLARGSNAPAVVLCTSGTAGAHFFPAIIEARHSGIPLWALTADRPWELHGFGAPQTMAQEGLFGRFVAASLNLPEPVEGPEVETHLSALIGEATRKGERAPLHLNVPFREPLAPEGPGIPIAVTPRDAYVPAKRVPDVTRVAQLLVRAERGIIYAGARHPDDAFGRAVHRLGEHLGFAVLAEAASGARYGEPNAISMYEAILRSRRGEFATPDAVVRFGTTPTSVTAQRLVAPTTVIVREGDETADPAHAASLVVEADAVAFCEALMEATPRRNSETWRSDWLAVERRAREVLAKTQAWSEPMIVREVIRTLPNDTNLVISNSMPIRDADAFAPTAHGRIHVFANRGVNGIDGIDSMALGIGAASSRKTVAIVGDLAFLHDLSAWVTAKALKLDLTTVVINNDGGGIFHYLPRVSNSPHFERYFGTPHQARLSGVAELSGASFVRVSHLEEVGPALHRALNGGLSIIEAKTSRQDAVSNQRALLDAVAEVVGQ